MKSTTLTALALTLLMFLLVSLAAFVFVFQGRLALQDDLAGAEQDLESLNQEQAQLQLERAALQSEATKIALEKATVDTENLLLTSQLAETDLVVTAQAAQYLKLAEENESIQADLQDYRETGPLVKIIAPHDSTDLVVGEETIVRIIASDPVGVESVSISIDNTLLTPPPVTPDYVVIAEQSWLPEDGGLKRITVRAVNSENGTSRFSDDVTVSVHTPTPTVTPTSSPTATPTPEPTSEP